MRILVVCERFNAGGAETRILTLCRCLRQKGHTVVVASSGGGLVDELIRVGVGHQTVEFLEWHDIGAHVDRLLSIITSHGIEIAHIHPYASLVPGVLAACQAGIPFVITMHGPFGFSQADWHRLPKEGFADLFVSAAIKRPGTRILASSPEVKYQLLSDMPDIAQNAITVIPNAVDGDLFRASEMAGPPRKFLIVSRLDPDKIPSIKHGMEAFRTYTRLAGGGCRLAIAGAGQSMAFVQQELRRLDRSLGQGSVTLLGQQNRMWEVIPGYDVVIGMGRVMIEAGMCGRIPVLAGYDGLKGVLCPANLDHFAETNFSGRGVPTVSPETIAQTIMTYPLDDLRDLRFALVSGFSAETWAEKEASVLERLLEDGKTLHSGDPSANLIRRLVELLYTSTQRLDDERARLWRLKRILDFFKTRASSQPAIGSLQGKL